MPGHHLATGLSTDFPNPRWACNVLLGLTLFLFGIGAAGLLAAKATYAIIGLVGGLSLFLALILVKARLFRIASVITFLVGIATLPVGALAVYAGIKVWNAHRVTEFQGSQRKTLMMLAVIWVICLIQVLKVVR